MSSTFLFDLKNELLSRNEYGNFRIRKAMKYDYLKIVNEKEYKKLKNKKPNENEIASYLPLLQVRQEKRNIRIELMIDNKACRSNYMYKERLVKLLENYKFQNKPYLWYELKNNETYETRINPANLIDIKKEINNVLWVCIYYVVSNKKMANINKYIIKYLGFL